MINAPVLVLNQNYEPLNVCDIRRAFRLLGAMKAELLARNHQVIHTPTIEIPAPSVIRLQYHVKRPQPRVKLSRREVFVRDRHTCQYCGQTSRDLTIDHVTPKHRGGRHEWENLVAACRPCNHRKGGKTVAEARMRLLREPRAPRADLRYLFGGVPRRRPERRLAHVPLPRADRRRPGSARPAPARQLTRPMDRPGDAERLALGPCRTAWSRCSPACATRATRRSSSAARCATRSCARRVPPRAT